MTDTELDFINRRIALAESLRKTAATIGDKIAARAHAKAMYALIDERKAEMLRRARVKAVA